MEHAEDLI